MILTQALFFNYSTTVTLHSPYFCFVTKVNDNPKKHQKCIQNDFRFFAKINDYSCYR